MPNTCCVTKCNGNYNLQNKVHIFNFPKNEELLKKWVKAIPRTNLIVTKNTKVCERHFQSDDIEFEATFYKKSTRETLRAKFKYPRLKDGAVPSIFPNCPKYLSSANKDRIDPISKKQLLEQQQVNKDLAKSLKSHCEFEKKFGFNDFFEMKNCFGINNVPTAWRIVEKDENLIF
nr:THAP domain-containing protein 2-like [Parasteatoda tepidariorum]